MVKIGKQKFIDSFDYSNYCNHFARDCWDNKQWAKQDLKPSECFEDDSGRWHTEVVSMKLNTIINNACERYYKIGLNHFGNDTGLEIDCSIFTDE